MTEPKSPEVQFGAEIFLHYFEGAKTDDPANQPRLDRAVAHARVVVEAPSIPRKSVWKDWVPK